MAFKIDDELFARAFVLRGFRLPSRHVLEPRPSRHAL